jgi:hypothetical protein
MNEGLKQVIGSDKDQRKFKNFHSFLTKDSLLNQHCPFLLIGQQQVLIS